MAKQNLKTKPAKTKLGKTKPRGSVVRAAKPTQKMKGGKVEQESEWHIEVAQLQSQVFPSMEKAIETLAKGVVEKLGISGRSAVKEREFVQLLLETDPELLKALEKSVKIK